MRTSLVGVVLLGFAAQGCVMQSTYDKDMGDLKAKMAADQKAGQDAMTAEQKKCADEKAAQQAASDAAAKDAAAKAEEARLALKRDYDNCVAAGGDKGKALAQCQRDKDDAQQRLAQVKASIEKVRQALEVMRAAGKLDVKDRNGFLTIALSGDILFDTGKSKLKDEASGVLRELAAIFKQMPDKLFQIAGHTDDQGDEEKNWNLSMERALTVVRFLIKEGVSGKTLSAGGYAFYQPLADNATPENRQKNRRVEFLLMPNLSELLKMNR